MKGDPPSSPATLYRTLPAPKWERRLDGVGTFAVFTVLAYPDATLGDPPRAEDAIGRLAIPGGCRLANPVPTAMAW